MTAPAELRAPWGIYTREGKPWSDGDIYVMQMVAAGGTNAQIARRLGVSMTAVAARLSRLYVRIGALNAPHAVAIMIGEGAIQPPRRKGPQQ